MLEYRVCEMTKQDFIDEGYGLLDGAPTDPVFTLFCVDYYEDGTIRGSINPFEGVGLAGKSIDELRVEIAKVAQALEHPTISLMELPGYVALHGDSFNPPVVTETDSPAEGFDDGSGVMVPGDAVEEQEDGPAAEPGEDVTEPDPDAAHDDPGEVESQHQEVMANLLGAALDDATEQALVPPDADDTIVPSVKVDALGTPMYGDDLSNVVTEQVLIPFEDDDLDDVEHGGEAGGA